VYCHECGTGNTVDSKYCKECGTKINDGYRTMMLSVQDLPVNQSEETLDKLTRLLDMAFWHNEAGNREAAIVAAEAALAINPGSTTAHSLLGTLYEKKGDDEAAIGHFEAVLALNPNSAADAAKLDQLRRGIHVQAAAPPAAHLWLPPAVVKLAPQVRQRWADLAGSRVRPGVLQRRPLMAAAAATGAVLICGLLLMRPWARAETVVTYPVSAPAPVTAGPNPLALPNTAPAPSAPPMVLMPAPSSSTSPPVSYAAPLVTAHDPFAGRASALAPAAPPRWSLPAGPPRRAARGRNARRDLPALRLAALPAVGGTGIAPAPVALPEGVPLATVEALPQHTVVVGSLAGRAPLGSAADLPAHIHITVHQARGGEADASPAPLGGGSDEGAKADSYQQRALSLQQGGDYRQARLSYQSAIRDYEAQIAAGQDVETAQRGLAACQTGLQICQQSQ